METIKKRATRLAKEAKELERLKKEKARPKSKITGDTEQ